MKKDVLNFEGLYQVDENGNVFSLDREVNTGIMYHTRITKKGRQLKPETQKNGYKRVLLMTRNGKRCHKLIHRLVAEAFIPNTYGLSQINHKDGNKANNHVSNLEWCTHQYNNIHALQTGLRKGRKKGKEIIIDNKVFQSIVEACKYYNTTRYKLLRMKCNDYPVREYIEGETPSLEAQQ